MANRREIVTANALYKELNSLDFIAGLDKAISLTEQSGRETQFGIHKKEGIRRVLYSEHIEIGSENQIGPAIIEEEKAKRFEKMFGRRPTKEDFRSVKLSTGMDQDELRKAIDANIEAFKRRNFEDNLPEHDRTKVEFPSEIVTGYSPDRREGNYGFEAGSFYNSKEDGLDYYPLLHLHTHPNGVILTSQADVEVLNERRMIHEKMGGLVPPTISMIAGVGKNRRPVVPLTFFQENSEMPLEDEQVKRAYVNAKLGWVLIDILENPKASEEIRDWAQEVYDLSYGWMDGHEKSGLLFESIGGTSGLYNAAVAFYDRGKGEVVFDRKDRLKDFEFRKELK
jgi:hypothetical protein